MQLKNTLTFFVLGLYSLSFSDAFPSPLLPRQGTGTGADSCPAQALTAETWTSLKIDTWLKNWSAKNVTSSASNNVESLAASFGAPNFFCGLDNFCNAGQPCLPVTLPAWYVLVAVQNWNSYMNSVNTAIGFASSIITATLPSIVNDLAHSPKAESSALKGITKMLATILGVVPFTGPIKVPAAITTSGLNLVSANIKPAAETDEYINWSDISASVATAVSDYQTAVSNSVKDTLDAKVDTPTTGINALLSGGSFLGISQNFSQADLQSQTIDSITVYSIGLVYQAQKSFVVRSNLNCPIARANGEDCSCTENGSAEICQVDPKDSTNWIWYALLRNDAVEMNDEVDLMISKYGFTKEQIILGPSECFDANGGKQLTDNFGDYLPLNRNTTCLFNVAVCDDTDNPDDQGIVDYCRNTMKVPI